MMGNCCPPALEPPTPEIKTCKLMLQGLAVGLLSIIILSIVVGLLGQFLMYLLLIFFLFLAWRTFNWCSVLFFFVYCLQQIIQISVATVGMVEYGLFFDKKHVLESILLILELSYFTTAIVISHLVYRKFKNLSNQAGAMLFGNDQGPQGGDYRQVPNSNDQMVRGEPVHPSEIASNRPNPPANQAFRGQAVRIG